MINKNLVYLSLTLILLPSFYLFYLKIINPDMTNMRLIINFSKEYFVCLIITLIGFLIFIRELRK